MDMESRDESCVPDFGCNLFKIIYFPGEILVPEELSAGVGKIRVIYDYGLESSCKSVFDMLVYIGGRNVTKFII